MTAVNDAPSFIKGSDVTVSEDSGAYTEAGWATALSAGPADESFNLPAPSFTVTNNNNALFLTQPAISTTGELTFTPADNANGSTLVTVTLSDNGGTTNGGVETSAAQTFRITIQSINDRPVAVADSYTVAEGDTLTVPATGVRVNDTDVEDGTPPTGDVTLVTQPAHHVGLFVLNPDGSFTYTHDGTETPTTDTFAYRVTDSAGAYSNVATATITITPVNEAPTAVDDSGAGFTVLEDSGLFTTPDVTTNDSDPEDGTPTGDVDVTVALAPVTAGTLVNNNNGTFNFTPADDFNGDATFSYTVDDSNGSPSNEAEVTITVTPVNDTPSFTLTASPNQSVAEDDGAQTVADLLTGSDQGAADESAQTLTLTVTNDDNGLFSAQPAIDLATGDLTYTPAPDANGEATVTVSISDNGGTANGGDDTSDDQTFTIEITPVNDAPSFAKGGDVVVAEDSGAYGPTAWATALSTGPANESTQTLEFTTAAINTGLFSAQPTINDDGELSFIPAANANGSTLVTVFVTDSGGTPGDPTSTSRTFTITITPVNDLPVVTLTTPLEQYIEGDGNVAIDDDPASFTVTDIDDDFLLGLTVEISEGAETGVDELDCPECAGLGITADFSAVSNTLTLSGPASPADYETALQSVTFANNSDTPSGADRELTVVATDGTDASAPVDMEFTFVVTSTSSSSRMPTPTTLRTSSSPKTSPTSRLEQLHPGRRRQPGQRPVEHRDVQQRGARRVHRHRSNGRRLGPHRPQLQRQQLDR